MTKYKRYSVRLNVDAEIEIYEVMREFTDEELLNELERRNKKPTPQSRDALLEAYECLIRKDAEEATLILHSLVFPKFKSVADAFLALAKVKETA
jgi:hypothetical protein